MSIYKDHIIELPKRIKVLIEKYFDVECMSKDPKEATLLISFAMPLFCITGERLTKCKNSKQIKEKYFNGFIKDKHWFCTNLSSNTLVGKTKNIDLILNGKPLLTSEREVLKTLSVFRNALAHGNIQFEESSTSDKIENIIFCSLISLKHPEEGYDYCKISVLDFKNLILNICNYLIANSINLIQLDTLIDQELKNAA